MIASVLADDDGRFFIGTLLPDALSRPYVPYAGQAGIPLENNCLFIDKIFKRGYIGKLNTTHLVHV